MGIRKKLNRHWSDDGAELKLLFSQNLRQLLKERNMTQAQLARSLQIERAGVSMWLRGDYGPGMVTISRLARHLDVDPAYFFKKR